jgi:hypothetical protein
MRLWLQNPRGGIEWASIYVAPPPIIDQARLRECYEEEGILSMYHDL